MKTALARMATQFHRAHADASPLPVVIGIHTRGVPLARAFVSEYQRLSGVELPQGNLDITFYRDDLSLVDEQPVVGASEIGEDIADRCVLLVDDVLFTGRTVRAALDSLLDYGRPSKIELAVLVDRGGRELPIQADYAGLSLETSEGEVVEVRVEEVDNDEQVILTRKELVQEEEKS